MPAAITTGQVWREIENQLFAVLGMVSKAGKARTAGIVLWSGTAVFTSEVGVTHGRFVTSKTIPTCLSP